MSKLNDLFKQDLKVINMGLESFYNDLKSQNVQTIQMAWKPPAGGNKKMMGLLARLKSK